MRRLGGVAVLALSLAVPPAAAQTGQPPPAEPTREIAAGGLIVLPDYALSLDKLEVTIGPDEIRVVYTITNTTTDPRTLQITFPLPELDATALGDLAVTLPKLDQLNYISLTYAVDGVVRPAKFEQRAVAFGLDVTAELTDANIPLFPYRSDTAERLAKLPESLRTDFAERGVARIEDDKVLPGWTVRTTAYWRQTFASGKSTVLTLTYQPIAATARIEPVLIETLKRSHCLDAAGEAAIARRAQADTAPGQERPLRWINYALSSGSSWMPAAKSFRLHIVRPVLDMHIATCRKGLKPVGPTVLEWTAKDFYADDDIAVLFIR